MKINRWDYEEVPKKERLYPDDEGLLGFVGSLRRTNERLVTIPYNGCVCFYSIIKEDWYEFFAKFTDGKLVSIQGGRKAI